MKRYFIRKKNAVLYFLLLLTLLTIISNTATAASTVLWSADMETGNTSQWSAKGGGAIVNSGGKSIASRNYAHSGSYSLQMTITAPPERVTSAQRWLEQSTNAQLNYTAWYLIPQHYSVANYWNVLQFGSYNRSTGRVDPFFTVNIGNRGDGSMYLYMFNWQTRQSYTQTNSNIQPGQWFRVDAFYACASDGSGHVTFSQNGTRLFDVPNVQTGYANSTCRVAFNNESDSVSPAKTTIYLDDISISTAAPTLAPSPTPLTITTTGLPAGTMGNPYSTTLAAAGGTSPYTWNVASGALPSGLSLSSAGVLSGTPTTAGIFAASFQVKDSAATPQIIYSGALSVNIAAASTGTVIWSADTETGDTSQWYLPCASAIACPDAGGGEFDSGSASTVASQDVAHSGSWSLKRTITTPPESGTRMFRWLEPHTYPKLHYSAWYYFPQRYSVTNYWNVFQWKSKLPSGQVDPFFVLNIGNRGDGTMYLYLYNWQTRQAFPQSLKNIPVGQWTKIEADYTCAGDNTGAVTFWQDGAQLFSLQNVQTRYSTGDCQWSIDSYSDGLTPSPATIYNDDAQIVRIQ